MSPASGTFFSEDPLEGTPEEPRTRERFSYAGQSPLNFSDPAGTKLVGDIALGMLALGMPAIASLWGGASNVLFIRVAHQEAHCLIGKSIFTEIALQGFFEIMDNSLRDAGFDEPIIYSHFPGRATWLQRGWHGSSFTVNVDSGLDLGGYLGLAYIEDHSATLNAYKIHETAKRYSGDPDVITANVLAHEVMYHLTLMNETDGKRFSDADVSEPSLTPYLIHNLGQLNLVFSQQLAMRLRRHQ